MSDDSAPLTPPPPPPPSSPTTADEYPVRLQIDYPDRLDRVTTAFRLILMIPIVVLLLVLTGSGFQTSTDAGTTTTTASVTAALFWATLLMILFRKRYPKWWFDFNVELTRFSMRVGAYVSLLTDRYPSTVERQTVRLDIDYPDAERDLMRGMPLVKWLLALPHLIVLLFLYIGAFFSVIIAWFAILFTGRYPRGLFDYVVGVYRWSVRVHGYAFLLTTDRYPPFSLK